MFSFYAHFISIFSFSLHLIAIFLYSAHFISIFFVFCAGLGGSPQYKFQEQTQCFLAPGGDPTAVKQQHQPHQQQQQQQQQQVNGGLYPSANSMGSMAGSSGGQGHSRMNVGVNPLAEYDLQNPGSGPGAGHSKQYFVSLYLAFILLG